MDIRTWEYWSRKDLDALGFRQAAASAAPPPSSLNFSRYFSDTCTATLAYVNAYNPYTSTPTDTTRDLYDEAYVNSSDAWEADRLPKILTA